MPSFSEIIVLPTPSAGVGVSVTFVGFSVEVIDGIAKVAEFSVGGTGVYGKATFLMI